MPAHLSQQLLTGAPSASRSLVFISERCHQCGCGRCNPAIVLVQVQLTLALAAVAVPINTLFGISAALLIARNNFPGKTVLLAILDLPFSISPVVTGLMLVGVRLETGC
jgi:ABC-type sulfate transport system permease subunit